MTFAILTPEDDATLHWRQPSSLYWQYVLSSGAGEFARLQMSGWTSSAIAETASARWELQHRGFWNPAIVAVQGEREVAVLEIRNAWLQNRADLRTPDGQLIATWEMQSFLRGVVSWVDPDGNVLITFRSGADEGGVASWIRTQCRVDLTAAGFAHPHRDLMLCIGWHIAVMASTGPA